MFGYRVWVCVCALCAFCMGPVRCSRDPQVLFSAKTTLKLGLTTLFTHLKIILLQCFQFSAISGIQTDPMWVGVVTMLMNLFFNLKNILLWMHLFFFFFLFFKKELTLFFFFALNSFVFLEHKRHFDVLSSLKTSNVSRKIDLFYLNNSLKPVFF